MIGLFGELVGRRCGGRMLRPDKSKIGDDAFRQELVDGIPNNACAELRDLLDIVEESLTGSSSGKAALSAVGAGATMPILVLSRVSILATVERRLENRRTPTKSVVPDISGPRMRLNFSLGTRYGAVCFRPG